MAINLIAAVGKRGQLGLNNTMPWKSPEDLKWFRKMTLGGILIMGARTVSHLPTPLLGRETIVPTRFETPAEILDKLHGEQREIWVAGGAKTYAQWLPYVTRFFISRIDYDGPADTWMPDLSLYTTGDKA